MSQQESMVKRATASLKAFGRTKIPKAFIAECTSSWQAHLEQISHYLLEGEGIWWKEMADSYVFFDGEDDLHFHPSGPKFKHFRQHDLKEIYSQKNATWEKLLQDNTPLPAPCIRLYSTEVKLVEIREKPKH